MKKMIGISSEGGSATGGSYLFVTHVGEPGGAELKMVRMCRLIPGSRVLTLSDGNLVRLLEKEKVPVVVMRSNANLLGVRREDGVWRTLLVAPTGLALMFRLVLFARDYDVLIPMSQKSFILLALIRPLVNKPIIWYMNDLVLLRHFSPFMIWLMVVLARFSADQVVCNSMSSKDAWIAAGGEFDNCTASYPGVDVDEIDEMLRNHQLTHSLRGEFSPNGKPLVTIVGRLSPWKGQDVFIRALAMLPGVVGLIVGDALFGDETYRDELKSLVSQLGLTDRVIFSGFRTDIPNIMAASDVVAHCSTAPEPFGQVIVQAMISGAPVVASNEGGPTEIIINEGFGMLVTPGDEKELAGAISKYLGNKDLSMAVAASAKERARTFFSMDATVKHLSRLINMVVVNRIA